LRAPDPRFPAGFLEGATLFSAEVERFKREHPGESILAWLCRRGESRE
jgi:hypothetical protein